jgi:hypothetical protein
VPLGAGALTTARRVADAAAEYPRIGMTRP